MVVFLCIAVALQIFAHTVTGKSKSVNLALETIIEFDKHNLDSDVKIIDNVQKFLSKVRNVLDANRIDNSRRMVTPYLQFTDFLQTCIETVKSFNDDDLQEFAVAFDEQIRKYHYKGCRFYELLENSDARQHISEKFEEFRNYPPKKLRKVLGKIQKKLNSKTEKEKALISLINSLYRLDTQNKFRTFIDNLQAYKSKTRHEISIDLSKIIKNGIRALIFDHFTNLHPNVRQDVKFQVTDFIQTSRSGNTNNVNDTEIKEEVKPPSTWKPHGIKHGKDKKKKAKKNKASDEVQSDSNKKEVNHKKHKHSKQLHKETENDIEAEVTNKWLFGDETTQNNNNKKSHRHVKHKNTKSDKKHKKHKKKKSKSLGQGETVTYKTLNLLFRMSSPVEERYLADKKETTKANTIIRVREAQPLTEIFSRNLAAYHTDGDAAFRNRSPQIMNKILPNKKDDTNFGADKSTEMSHSEQDKKDGLSIEAFRRGISYYRRDEADNNTLERKQEVRETVATTIKTTIDPYVLQKIYNLEEELMDVKKKMQEPVNKSTSESSDSESESSDEKNATESKRHKTTKTSISTIVNEDPKSACAGSTTAQKITSVSESSSENSSSETEAKDSANGTTTENTTSEVEVKTSDKKPTENLNLQKTTTSLTTTTNSPLINNSTSTMLVSGKKTNSIIKDDTQISRMNPAIPRAKNVNQNDLKKYSNTTTELTTEVFQNVAVTRNDVFEIKFSIKQDSAVTETETPTTAKLDSINIIFKSHDDDANSKVKNSTNYSNQTDIPDIVDVISVLNSTMSTKEKLEKLQGLRRKIDLMSDDDPNAMSKEYANRI